MKTNSLIRLALAVLSIFGSAWAQSGTEDGTATNRKQSSGPPAAAGFTTADNLPVSAVDQQPLAPSLGRNLIIPGLEFSSGGTSDNGVAANSSPQSVSRVIGSLGIERVGKRQAFDLEYLGGGTFYATEVPGQPQMMQEHQLQAEHRFLWQTGQLTFHDAFSYLPEGSFGNGSFGGTGNLVGVSLPSIGSGQDFGNTGSLFFGSSGLAVLGQQPRITNITTADVIQHITPRASVTVAGSYGLVHFTDDAPGVTNSRQVSVQAGYNYQLTWKDQIGVVYGYQGFHYPEQIGHFTTHMASVLYGHRISERLDLILGGGPQATQVTAPGLSTYWSVSASGRATLRARFSKSSAALEFERYNTNGSGVFGGALSNVARLSASQTMGRKWNAVADLGYTRNSRILPVTNGTSSEQFSYFYASGGLRRQLNRNFGIYMSYQYNQNLYDSSFCRLNPVCERTPSRHMGFVGLDWHPSALWLNGM